MVGNGVREEGGRGGRGRWRGQGEGEGKGGDGGARFVGAAYAMAAIFSRMT